MSQVAGQQTYGDACKCYIPSKEKGGEGKARVGEGKSGGQEKGKGSGEEGKRGSLGKAAVKTWVQMQGNQCLCGPTGASGEKGKDAKGFTLGQRTVRP